MALDTLNAAQKTPASMLQELCALNDLTADYKLMSVEGVVHAPTFKYRVQLEDYIAVATGASKKKAKHAAAKALLEKLLSKDGKFPDGFMSDDIHITTDVLQELFEETSEPPPVEESEIKNPVGSLQEICIKFKNKWSPPLYETEDESGLPHERVFQISCFVEFQNSDIFEKVTATARAKSKKLAKHQAAEQMLIKLKELNLIKWEEGKFKDLEDKDDKKEKELHENLPIDSELEKDNSDEVSTNGCEEEEEEVESLITKSKEVKLPDSVTLFEGNLD